MAGGRVAAAVLVLSLALFAVGWHLAARPAGPSALAWDMRESGAAGPDGAGPSAAGEGLGSLGAGGRGGRAGSEGVALAGAPEAGEARSETAAYGPYEGGRTAGWVVDVEGAVARPGAYVLPEGARVWDAVKAAGGLAADAETGRVNLAAELSDGAYVYVPRKGESAQAAPAGEPSGTAGGEGARAGPGARAKVDLNRAGLAELEALPGIGPKLAERIVAERAAHGPFASLEDLAARVSGIGPKLVESLRPYVLVR